MTMIMNGHDDKRSLMGDDGKISSISITVCQEKIYGAADPLDRNKIKEIVLLCATHFY